MANGSAHGINSDPPVFVTQLVMGLVMSLEATSSHNDR